MNIDIHCLFHLLLSRESKQMIIFCREWILIEIFLKLTCTKSFANPEETFKANGFSVWLAFSLLLFAR